MKKLWRWLVPAFVLLLALLGATQAKDLYRWTALRGLRATLLTAIRPVQLSNCTMKRFGDAHDGGYLLCENLMGRAQSAYSYGIDGRDEWGCALSLAYHLPVHQYDCFNPKRPVCGGGHVQFHDECVGPAAVVADGRVFDTIANQVARNGHADKHIVVKMDVESAEWDSFAALPERTFETIDQLVVELHGLDDPKYLQVLEKLKKHFYIVNVHFNNYACMWWSKPFPALAYEVLMVNKRLGSLDLVRPIAMHPNPLDEPNDPSRPDCQEAWDGEDSRVARALDDHSARGIGGTSGAAALLQPGNVPPQRSSE